MRLRFQSILALLVLGLAILAGSTSWFRVQEHEEALVLTMGRATRLAGKGFHFKLPWPVEEAVILPVRLTQQLTFGYRETGSKLTDVAEEALMITGDESLVWADLLVEWKIADIKKYAFHVEEPEQLLRNAVSASLRSVMGTTNLDTAITTGKFQLQAEVENRLKGLMQEYDAGITVISVKLQDVEPPVEVTADFKAVTDAREAKVTKVNEATKYRNEKIPQARGEAQRLIEHAEGAKVARINAAQGDVARYKAIFDAYKLNPQVTERRLILETLEQILPGADITIVDSSDGTIKYLPLAPRKGE